ncbi:MAG: radical SAM protein [Desulfobacteraceae bacterium]|nr:radical SAM protein [Desulfobacteraceae bacterium]
MEHSPHILCVNPWIHDFAAYDFWAKPLGLLYIAAILRKAGCRISFIDCLDRFHEKENQPAKILWDGRGPYRKIEIPRPDGLPDIGKRFSRYGIKPEWLKQDLQIQDPPDLILVTSLMTYWATGVKETIETIKDVYPNVPVVLGGIYANLCCSHAQRESGADLVLTGPVKKSLKKVFKDFLKMDLTLGIDSRDLDSYPYPALDLQNKIAYAPILTSRGCPYSCEYCASSFLEPKLRQRSPENVFMEIQHWHENFKVKNFAFYDDALLVNGDKYAYSLFESIISSDMDVWFHTPNALHVKELTKQACELMFKAGFKTIRLGLETTDFSHYRRHDVKVREDDFFQAVENLKTAGFEKGQIGAYLLCGLPGQSLDEVKNSMNLVKKSKILPVLAYYTPIPHTPMWETAIKQARFDISQHPVLTNNTLFPCVNSDKTIQQIAQLKNL